MQVLIKRRDKVSLGTEEIRVPYTEQTTEHRDVLLQGRFLEVFVHSMGAGEELVKILEANVKRDAETNGAPHAVTAANPALEAEHVLLVDAEFSDFALVGRESNEVLGYMAIILCGLEEPFLGRGGIGGSLRCGKGF